MCHNQRNEKKLISQQLISQLQLQGKYRITHINYFWKHILMILKSYKHIKFHEIILEWLNIESLSGFSEEIIKVQSAVSDLTMQHTMKALKTGWEETHN